MIEPTETECKEELDYFISVMKRIRKEAESNPEKLKNAPYTLPVKRLDDVKAAREINVNYFAAQEQQEFNNR